jgi:hypothetical protein
MKFLVPLSLMLLTSASHALAAECPRVEGAFRWQGEGASTRISMVQQGCAIVHLEMDPGEGQLVKRDLIPDGVRRTLERADGVVATEWSEWSESGIRIHLEEHYGQKKTTIGTHAEWTVNAEGDLVEDLLITQDGAAIYRNAAVFRRER